jgi:hypothetical protein
MELFSVTQLLTTPRLGCLKPFWLPLVGAVIGAEKIDGTQL